MTTLPTVCETICNTSRMGTPLRTSEALHALGGNPNVSHAKASRELGYPVVEAANGVRIRPEMTSLIDVLDHDRKKGPSDRVTGRICVRHSIGTSDGDSRPLKRVQ